MPCVLIACALLSLTGCKPPPAEHEFYKMNVAPQMLREIQTLDLKPAKPQTQTRPVPDANQPPPAELELTLEQCRALALENNLDLKAQLISPAIAAERISEEEARFEAALVSNLSYSKSDTPVGSILDITGSNVDYGRADLGVQMPLRTG